MSLERMRDDDLSICYSRLLLMIVWFFDHFLDFCCTLVMKRGSDVCSSDIRLIVHILHWNENLK